MKKKADRNCISKDPNDCLVWCLVEVPEELLEVKNYLLDTTVTSEYEVKKVATKNLINLGGHIKWFEVVCANKITRNLVESIQTALIEDDIIFNIRKVSGKFDKKTKTALKAYQRAYNLPLGNLDNKTLSHMNISLK